MHRCLQPGESATVEFSAAEHDWCPFCTVDAGGVRAVRAGEYIVRIGGDGGTDGECGAARAGECAVYTLILEGATVARPL